MSRRLSDFWEIADNYDTFVFDIWGVVHDGIARLPGVLETIQALKQKAKPVYFLSNMPHDAEAVAKHLACYDICPADYEAVYSSGQAAIDFTEQLIAKGLKFAYLLGQAGSMSRLMTAKGLEFVTDIQLADVLILSHDDSVAFDRMKSDIQAAVQRQVPMVCTNPDRFYLEGGQVRTAAGSLAQLYQELGGQVIYIGKPYAFVYQQLQKLFAKKTKILAVGDSLENDILGAHQMQWDSLLVLTGVSASYDENHEHNIQPTYCLSHF